MRHQRTELCRIVDYPSVFVDRVFYRFVRFFIEKTDKNPTANAKVLSTGSAAHALIA